VRIGELEDQAGSLALSEQAVSYAIQGNRIKREQYIYLTQRGGDRIILFPVEHHRPDREHCRRHNRHQLWWIFGYPRECLNVKEAESLAGGREHGQAGGVCQRWTDLCHPEALNSRAINPTIGLVAQDPSTLVAPHMTARGDIFQATPFFEACEQTGPYHRSSSEI
jgi:hypothetical protein